MSHCNEMPTLTIYLTNELYDKVKDAPSKIVRAALEKYFQKSSANPEQDEKKTRQPSKEP